MQTDPHDESLASTSPEILKVRQDVPEFEAAFRALLLDEGGELGVFQAMSAFADWLGNRHATDPRDPVVDRAAAALEKIRTTKGFRLGPALVAEFVEAAMERHPELLSQLGPETLRFRQI
ncbi:hypothetical protein ACWEOW_09995 [Monashia sp. NPDC004114]